MIKSEKHNHQFFTRENNHQSIDQLTKESIFSQLILYLFQLNSEIQVVNQREISQKRLPSSKEDGSKKSSKKSKKSKK